MKLKGAWIIYQRVRVIRDKNAEVALLSHNPQKGTVTLFDKQGNVLNEVRLSDNDKAWTTIDPKASEYYHVYVLNTLVNVIDPDEM